MRERVIEVMNVGIKNKRKRSYGITGNEEVRNDFLIHTPPACLPALLIHSPSLSESRPHVTVSFQGEGWLTDTDMESCNIRYISWTDCISAQNILVPSCSHLSAACCAGRVRLRPAEPPVKPRSSQWVSPAHLGQSLVEKKQRWRLSMTQQKRQA